MLRVTTKVKGWQTDLADASRTSIDMRTTIAYVQLNSEDDPNYCPRVYYQSWAIADHHLQRLAKLLSSEHPGEKMEVIVSECHWAGPLTDDLVQRLGSEKFLPGLKEKAEFRLGSALDDFGTR